MPQINSQDLITGLRKMDEAFDLKTGRIEQMMIDLRYKEVLPAIKETEETVKKVDSLVKESKVNKQSISNIQSAIEQAKIGANTAMARAQELLKDINHINDKWADSDRTINEQRQRLDQWATELTSAKTNLQSLHDSLNDTAKQLSSLTDQAKKQGNTLILVQQNMDGIKQSVADVKGNVTSLSQRADLLQATVTDQAKSISQLSLKADGLSSQVSTLNDKANQQAQSISQFNQTATSLQGQVASLTDASGKQAQQISEMKLDAEGVHTAVSELSETVSVNLAKNNMPDWVKAVDGQTVERIPVKPNTQYSVSIDMQVTKPLANSAISAYFYECDSSNKRGVIRMTNLNGGVTTVQTEKLTFTTGATTTNLEVVWLRSSSAIEANVRHLMVNEGATVKPYTSNSYSFKDMATLDQTAQSLKVGVTNNKGDLDALKITADGLRQDITNANNDIFSLRNRADGFDALIGTKVSQADLNDVKKSVSDASLAINANKKALEIKANQTDVDRLKQTVNDANAQLGVQANQIKGLVTKSELTTATNGMATQNWVQTQVAQQANQWNLNITDLQTKLDKIPTGGVNLIVNSGADWKKVAGNGYMADYYHSFACQPGERYVISVEFRNATLRNGTWWGIQVWTGVDNGGRQSPIITSKYSNETSGTVTLPFTVPANTYYIQTTLCFSNGSQTGSSIEYRHLMGNKGMVPAPWTPAPTDLVTVKSVTDLTATVDGIKGTVQSKADKSEVTQLSNAIQQKVSNADYNSKISQLANDINARVTKGDVIGQINLTAGRTLIKNGKIVLEGDTIMQGGTAWIDSAMITSLSADKIQGGMINTNNLKIGNDVSQIISVAGKEFRIQNLKDSSQLRMAQGLMQLKQSIGSNWGGFSLDNGGGHVRMAVVNSDYPSTDQNVVEMNGKQIGISVGVGSAAKAHSQIWLEKGLARIVDVWNPDSPTAMKLDVRGWANVAGYVEAMGHSTHSTLSSKTNIVPMDIKESYDLINQTDLTWFTYKRELVDGNLHRHAGPIIDDVNKVSQYRTPKQFISPNGEARDDGNIIGTLMGAVQYLSKKVEELEKNG